METAPSELRALVMLLFRRWYLLLLAAVTMAIMLPIVVLAILPPKFTASAFLYMGNFGAASASVYLLKEPEILRPVMEEYAVSADFSQFRRMVSISLMPETQLVRVSVTAQDPVQASALANGIARMGQKSLPTAVDCETVIISSSAVPPDRPDGHGAILLGLMGGFLGAGGMTALITFWYLLLEPVLDEEELHYRYQLPVIASVPLLGSRSGEKIRQLYPTLLQIAGESRWIVVEDLPHWGKESGGTLLAGQLFSQQLPIFLANGKDNPPENALTIAEPRHPSPEGAVRLLAVYREHTTHRQIRDAFRRAELMKKPFSGFLMFL